MYKYIIITNDIKLLIKNISYKSNQHKINNNNFNKLINDNDNIYINYYNELYKYYAIKQYEHHIELVLLSNNNYKCIKFYKYSDFYQTISRKYITYNLFPNDKRMVQQDNISILNLFLNLSKFN